MGKLTERWAVIYLQNEIKAVEDQVEDLKNVIAGLDPEGSQEETITFGFKQELREKKIKLQGLEEARNLVADSFRIHGGKSNDE